MKCEKCGSEIPAASTFCPMCGQPAAERAPAAAQPPEYGKAPEPPAPKNEPEAEPFYMPRAEDRPNLKEKPPKQKLPVTAGKENTALYIISGSLLAAYVLYRLYYAIFTGTSGLLTAGRGLFFHDYVIILAAAVLSVFCFTLRHRKKPLYIIPLGLLAVAYIAQAAMSTVYFVFMLHPLLMLALTILLILTATGVIKTCAPALIIALMQAGVGVYGIYSMLMGRLSLSGIPFSVFAAQALRHIVPALLYIALALFAAASARKKTL